MQIPPTKEKYLQKGELCRVHGEENMAERSLEVWLLHPVTEHPSLGHQGLLSTLPSSTVLWAEPWARFAALGESRCSAARSEQGTWQVPHPMAGLGPGAWAQVANHCLPLGDLLLNLCPGFINK